MFRFVAAQVAFTTSPLKRMLGAARVRMWGTHVRYDSSLLTRYRMDLRRIMLEELLRDKTNAKMYIKT